MATTVNVAGQIVTVDAEYEAMQDFWVRGANQGAVAEFETADGRATIAATAIQAIYEAAATTRTAIGFR